jgi:hypothetical protein
MPKFKDLNLLIQKNAKKRWLLCDNNKIYRNVASGIYFKSSANEVRGEVYKF